MADLQQHFISHRRNSAQQASEDFEDITGAEYNRLAALAEKISKGDGDTNEDGKNNEQNNNNTTPVPENGGSQDASVSITPLSVAGTVASFTISSGLSLLFLVLGMKKYYNA